MKRISCILMIICVISVSKVSANSNVYVNELVRVVENSISKLDEYDCNARYYIGSKINVYETSSGELIPVERASTYPVFVNEKLSYFATLSNDSIKVAKIALKSNDIIANGFLILSNETSAYIVGDREIELISVVPGKDVINISNELIEYSRLLNDYDDNLTEIFPNNYQLLSITNFPLKSQYPFPNGCWAACIAAFCKYYRNLNYTAADVVRPYYGSSPVPSSVPTKSMDEIKNILNVGYHIVTVKSNSCSNISTFINMVNSNKLFIIGWQSYTNGGHVTCMYDCELDSLNRFTIYIMDPYGAYGTLTSSATTYALTGINSTFPTNNLLFGSNYGIYYYGEDVRYDYWY